MDQGTEIFPSIHLNLEETTWFNLSSETQGQQTGGYWLPLFLTLLINQLWPCSWTVELRK
jgi:hypothetical protein